jgi:[CysO sulfur-carrier protein]-S-L-cysteine hydrolase
MIRLPFIDYRLPLVKTKSCGPSHSSFCLSMFGQNAGDYLRLRQPIYRAILYHLEAVYPQEGCGLLAGHWHDKTATSLYVVENQAPHPQTQFLMSPLSQVTAFLEIEAAGMDLLAIYHSHPKGPGIPSAADMAQAYYPDVIQVVVSLANRTQPALRAFWLTNTCFSEIRLIVE